MNLQILSQKTFPSCLIVFQFGVKSTHNLFDTCSCNSYGATLQYKYILLNLFSHTKNYNADRSCKIQAQISFMASNSEVVSSAFSNKHVSNHWRHYGGRHAKKEAKLV